MNISQPKHSISFQCIGILLWPLGQLTKKHFPVMFFKPQNKFNFQCSDLLNEKSMPLTHWRAPGDSQKDEFISGLEMMPWGTPPCMIKQHAPECIQALLHYYPACAPNASWRRRDDSIDRMKVRFIFPQILSPAITKALHYCGLVCSQFVKCAG